jgi:hypothetical protein
MAKKPGIPKQSPMKSLKGRTKASDDYKKDFKHSDQPKKLGKFKGKKGTRSGLAKYRKKENMPDAEARKKLFDQLDAEAKRYGKEPTPDNKADGGMMNKKLTKTVPPKKGPNSQGMRGTGSAIRGTKFKGVF